MRTLHVELGERRYPVLIGREIPPASFNRICAERRTVCVVDARVARLHKERLDRILPGAERLLLPAGEASKSLAELERLARELLALGLGRDGLLLAVGGGVTGDLTGFLAASYLRGIPFLQVPTTLLAQVDASVGGKVAVNLPGAKNSLGFFLQPEAVLADMAFLETLPRREMAAGLAELIKMAAILDSGLLSELETENGKLLAAGNPSLEDFIFRSCELKAAVVKRDEKEAGPRQILNFGHTLAHAIESSGPEPAWLHGEAVAVGMLAALRLGERSGHTPAGRAERLEGILAGVGLPLRLPPEFKPAQLRERMESDKKRSGGRLNFVLLEDWGRATYGVEIEEALVLSILEELLPEE